MGKTTNSFEMGSGNKIHGSVIQSGEKGNQDVEQTAKLGNDNVIENTRLQSGGEDAPDSDDESGEKWYQKSVFWVPLLVAVLGGLIVLLFEKML